MAHIKTQTEWEDEMALKIYEYIKSTIYKDMNFLYKAMAVFKLMPDRKVNLLASDGYYLYVNSEKMINLIKSNDKYLMRAYLHTLVHCIFSHLWIKGERNFKLWGLACDIFVEKIIDNMDKDCTRRILGFMRIELYKELEKRECVSASNIYSFLENLDDEQKLELLYKEFYTDDHYYWPDDNENKNEMRRPIPNNIKDVWEKKASELKVIKDLNGNSSEEELDKISRFLNVKRNKRSYRDFLRKFAFTKEELVINQEEFDISLFTYGLQLYKDIPIIEPLESMESTKIKDFIIVLDTSYSTSGDLIKKFVSNTLEILCEDDNFFRKNNIRIIQCDDKVVSDVIYKPSEDISVFFNNFEIKGGGNTDFRPAFVYINELLENKKIEDLQGVLYFTDGKGIYPNKGPEYKTAFVFLTDYEEDKVPLWAIRYKLEE